MHPCLHVTARLGHGVLCEVKQPLAGCIGRCERIATSAVTRYAGAGHRFLAPAIHIDRESAGTGAGVVSVELKEARAAIGARTELDGVGTFVLELVFDNGRVEVDARVCVAGCSFNKIVFNVGGDGAGGILAKSQIAPIAQVANVTKDDVHLCARGRAKSVCRFEFGKCVLLVRRIDRSVISSRPFD